MQNNLLLVLLRSSAVEGLLSLSKYQTDLPSSLLQPQRYVWSWGSSTGLLSLRRASKWENLIITNDHHLQSRKLLQSRYTLVCNFSAEPVVNDRVVQGLPGFRDRGFGPTRSLEEAGELLLLSLPCLQVLLRMIPL